MNTEYAIGKIRIPFASQARRRWFVGVVYAVIAAWLTTMFSPYAKWIVPECGILFVGLWIVFSWIAGDMRARGDEREMHRRDHAHYVAYRFVAFGVTATILAGALLAPNPVTAYLPLMVQSICVQLPKILLWATFFTFITLPQAILMWTEPDMDAGAE